MLKTFCTRFSSVTSVPLLKMETLFQQSMRTTFVLKRRNVPFMNKKGLAPKRFRARHYIYDLLQDLNLKKQHEIKLILTQYVEGLGNTGDHVHMKPNKAYNNLILPGLAVYDTIENIKRFEYLAKDEEKHSSPVAKLTTDELSRITLSVVMNKETPWTLKTWHIRTSFRKCGYYVPDETIQLPKTPISGPNMNFENKEFYVTVTINNLETAHVRCRIHHWSTNILDRIPHQHEFWKTSSDSIFHEDASHSTSLLKKGNTPNTL